MNHKCTCDEFTGKYFCSSRKCRNDVHAIRPCGSTAVELAGTDEGSSWNTITGTRKEANPLPKPSNQENEEFIKTLNSMQTVIDNADKYTNAEIIENLMQATSMLTTQRSEDYWTSEDGQNDLLKRISDRDERPPSYLSVFDYSDGTKAMLCSTGPSGKAEEWIEVELTADTGACDTVMPRAMAAHIPIQASLQSLKSMMYEVADGNEIPNLGERRCLMWTESATEARKINLQVADVHKALLSLSRCADMGFESRFGRRAGALIDEESGEVIPLQRKGNLYVLKCWLKAAPFGRQESR
jgi:hypothetical protein